MNFYYALNMTSGPVNEGLRNVPSGSTHTTCTCLPAHTAQSFQCIGEENDVCCCLSRHRRKGKLLFCRADAEETRQYHELVPDVHNLSIFRYLTAENIFKSSQVTNNLHTICINKPIKTADTRTSCHTTSNVRKSDGVFHNWNAVVTGFGSKVMPQLFSNFGTLRLSRSFLITVFFMFTIASLYVDCAPLPTNSDFTQNKLSLRNSKANTTFLQSIGSEDELSLILEDAGLKSLLDSINIPSIRSKRASGGRKGKKKSKRRRRKHKKGRKGKRKGGKGKKSKKRLTEKGISPNRLIELAKEPDTQPESSTTPRQRRLYNKAGNSFHLAVWKNGKVGGEESSLRGKYSILETRSAGENGIITIKGIEANKFICVSKKGTVNTRKKYSVSRCRFREKILENKQNAYESLSCSGCYLNLNKKGKVRRLKNMDPNNLQTHFLPTVIHHSISEAKSPKIITATFPPPQNGLETEVNLGESQESIFLDTDIDTLNHTLKVDKRRKARKYRLNSRHNNNAVSGIPVDFPYQPKGSIARDDHAMREIER
ncbi:uncharacterized protein LOC143450318 [Clavelina lepadiformis]|uniref:uncharacterized protein LOC143450318 n=1 Tax=Clavelina lepadiformis TaxID=159417 RepID=UPI004041781F